MQSGCDLSRRSKLGVRRDVTEGGEELGHGPRITMVLSYIDS